MVADALVAYDIGRNLALDAVLVVSDKPFGSLIGTVVGTLSVGVLVIHVVLIVDDKLHVLGRVVVDSEGESVGGTAGVVLRAVEVGILITGAKLQISPAPAGIDAGVFCSVCIVVLLASEQQPACLYVISLGCLGFEVSGGDDCLGGIEVCAAGNVSSLITQAVPVSGELEGIGKFVVQTLDGIGVEELLAVDAGRVA